MSPTLALIGWSFHSHFIAKPVNICVTVFLKLRDFLCLSNFTKWKCENENTIRIRINHVTINFTIFIYSNYAMFCNECLDSFIAPWDFSFFNLEYIKFHFSCGINIEYSLAAYQTINPTRFEPCLALILHISISRWSGTYVIWSEGCKTAAFDF